MSELLEPHGLIATLVYTSFGIVVFLGTFVFMVKVVPFSLRKEIEEDQNTALAIVMGAVILGLAIIIAATVSA